MLVRIGWTQPTLSAAEVRRNGNTVAAPEPIIPSDFVIQLYAPDQTIHVRQKPGSWGSSGYWEFGLPQHTFRQPSASDLDRSRSDPTTTETTPKINFRWKRDGKLSRDLICLLSGKSTDPTGIKKKSGSKEPDIAIALFKHFREITIYEPNLSRVEMEDLKGLEVVLLLSAAVIKDVFFGNPREIFNLSTPAKELENTVGEAKSPIPKALTGVDDLPTSRRRGYSSPNLAIPSQTSFAGQHFPQQSSSIPNSLHSQPVNHHNQIEIDRETARIRAQLEEEERAKARAEEAEVRRIKKMLKAEEKEARRRQGEVDRESERLKKIYGWEQAPSVKETKKQSWTQQQQVPRQSPSHSAPLPQEQLSKAHSVPAQQHGSRIGIRSNPQLSNRQPETGVQSLPLRIKQATAGGAPSVAGRDMQAAETRQAAAVKKKKSIFGLRISDR